MLAARIADRPAADRRGYEEPSALLFVSRPSTCSLSRAPLACSPALSVWLAAFLPGERPAWIERRAPQRVTDIDSGRAPG